MSPASSSQVYTENLPLGRGPSHAFRLEDLARHGWTSRAGPADNRKSTPETKLI